MRPAFVVIAVVALLLLGLMFLAPPPEKNNDESKNVQANGSAAGQPANASQNVENASVECRRVFTYCYTGETIMSQDCIGGKPVKWVCEPYYARHNKSTAGIPSQFMYIAEYACYWENRDKFGFAANYNPAAMCEGPIVLGWKESCDCAGYIDLVERSNPQRYYIKR